MTDSNNPTEKPRTTGSQFDGNNNKIFLNPKFKSDAKHSVDFILGNIEPMAVLGLNEGFAQDNLNTFIRVLADKSNDAYEPLAVVGTKKPENTDEAYQEFTSSLRDSTIKDTKSLKALATECMSEYLDSLPEDYEVRDGVRFITVGDMQYFNHPDKAHEETHKAVNAKEPVLSSLFQYYESRLPEIKKRFDGSMLTRNESIISTEYYAIQEANAISAELKNPNNKIWMSRSVNTLTEFFVQSPENAPRIFGFFSDLVKVQLFGLKPNNPKYPYLFAEIISLFGEKVLYNQPGNRYFLNLNFLFGENFLDKDAKLSNDALFRAGSMVMGQEIKALKEGDGKLKRDNLAIEAAPIIEEKTDLLTKELVEVLNNVLLWNEFKKQSKADIPQYLTDNMIKDAFDKKGAILSPQKNN